MPANFSNLRLRYIHQQTGKEDLNLVFNLSSLNFDINHAILGPLTPFTSEMSFVLNIEDDDNSNFSNLRELSNLLNVHFKDTDIWIDPNTATDAQRVKQITTLLQGVMQPINEEETQEVGVFINNNIELWFRDIDGVKEKNNLILSRSSSLQVLASPINIGESELCSLAWLVKIKFHAAAPREDEDTMFRRAVVLYPEINFPTNILLAPLNLVESYNDEMRLNYELTYLPETAAAGGPQPTGIASTMGRAADEIADSLANLTNTLAANLTSTFKTQLQPAGSFFSKDIALWVLIKKGTDELSFTKFFNYMEAVFCGEDNYNGAHITDKALALDKRRSLPFMNVDAYRAVKIATEAFVMVNCMVNRCFTSDDIEDLSERVPLVNGVPDETELSRFFNEYKERVNGGKSMIPYLAVIRRKLSNENLKFSTFEDAFDRHFSGRNSSSDETSCYGIISEKLTNPCFLELIWSYWHEESMMVQGLNAVSRRFQNIRGPGAVDPLANLEIDPLRPLNNLMWGYIQDHQHRLSVRRRAYEYNHHYGITLKGEAARDMRYADPRSKFIEAFHTLLNLASRFYKQADDLTVRPDGFPILDGLRETHLILSEGAHNQYGDLPSVARAEMLMEQWLLARPEYGTFLPTRVMVAYPEPWMDRVAALNQLLGHTKTSVLHFNYLAIYGEKILLSVRFGDWSNQQTTAREAANWANFWRPEIQAYIHAYRTVTGVDLSADGVMAGQRVDTQQPSTHLFRRLAEQQNGNGQMTKRCAPTAQ